MPKVRALGSFRMQLEAAAKRAHADKLTRAKEIKIELEEMKSAIGVLDGKKATDAEFAEMIGMTPRHYRLIKEDPLKLTVDEIRAIRAVAGAIGKRVFAGVKEGDGRDDTRKPV